MEHLIQWISVQGASYRMYLCAGCILYNVSVNRAHLIQFILKRSVSLIGACPIEERVLQGSVPYRGACLQRSVSYRGMHHTEKRVPQSLDTLKHRMKQLTAICAFGRHLHYSEDRKLSYIPIDADF